MAEITFTKEQKQQLIDKLHSYFEQELNQELGQFDGEFLFDFISAEFGPHFYNQGLYDAQAVMQGRIDSVMEAIYEIEKSV